MAEARWLKGTLTGTCVGKPTRKRGGSGLARWYQLHLVEAVISDWEAVAGPPSTAPKGPPPFGQATLKDARLRSRTPGGTDEELSLQELSVWDWKMKDQREAGGESRCTLSGTVYAREVPGTRRPVLPEGADRLGPWGILAVLAGLMVAFWLWWSCGPFTCGLWSSVVLVSWWSHRMRTRRRTPPALLSKILQGVLGFILILGGVGLVLGMTDPAYASSCGETAGLAVLLAVGGVVGASLLSVWWPLPWVWTLWTIVVVLWCGRTGTDCAGQWLKRARDTVKGASPRPSPIPEDLLRRLTGEGDPETGRGDSGSGGTPSGPGSGGTAGPETGSGGTGSGGTGSGGTGSGGPGSGDAGGAGGMGTGGTRDGGNTSGGASSGGTGSGEALTGAADGGTSPGSGGGQFDPSPSGKGGTGVGGTGTDTPGEGEADGLEASTEPRMSVEAALSDPKPFLDGSTRVTLSGDLLFEFDEDRLKPDAAHRLRQVAQLLRLDPRQRVLLEGHADTIGGDQYNQELSERRAEAVKAWLVERAHINPLQIDTVGYGSARPIVPASRGPAAQLANRRVEVRVLSSR